MTNQRLSIACRHLLLESKFIVLALSSLLFLGVPYWQLSSVLYTDFKSFKQTSSLAHDFATTPGIINKIYQVKSFMPGRSETYVFEFSYLGKQGKIITIDKKQLTTNKIGDHVLVLYNAQSAVIEHIPSYFLPLKLIMLQAIIAMIVLLLPILLAITLMLKSLAGVWRVYALHTQGVLAIGEIIYFKTMRHNAYLVEYLYTPAHSNTKIRYRTKATNYAAIGEKKPGDVLQVLYAARSPSVTCVNEKL